MDEVERRIKALGGKDEVVRRAAARALRDTGDPRAVEPLIRGLEDEGWRVRKAAARGLGKIGDPRAVKPLVRALEDKNEWVRIYAARALGQIKDPRAVKPLIRALEDKNVRQSVASALGKIGDPRAVETLTQALGDKDMVVRKAAGRALEKIPEKVTRRRYLSELLLRLDQGHELINRESLGQIFSAPGIQCDLELAFHRFVGFMSPSIQGEVMLRLGVHLIPVDFVGTGFRPFRVHRAWRCDANTVSILSRS